MRSRAYAPYSHYFVGAAVQDDQGRIFVGVNVENASYGATICAERSAVLALITAGGKKIHALAVCTQNGGKPCGMCLQVLQEFALPETPIVICSDAGSVRFTLGDLLPMPYEPKDLEIRP